MKQLNKLALKSICVFILLCESLYAEDYRGKLPSSLNLPANTMRTDTAIADCSYFQCTFNYDGPSFTYSTSTGSSNLTIQSTLPNPLPPGSPSRTNNIDFYMQNATINPNSNLILNGFHTIILEGAMTLNSSSLIFTSNTSGSFQINSKGSVLLDGGTLTLTMGGGGFYNANQISLNNGSTFTFTGTNPQNVANISIDSTSSMTINAAKFENIGQDANSGFTSSVANLTINGGSLIVSGNLFNGGTNQGGAKASGGGNITLYGGSLSANSVYSMSGGGKNSSISLYGGILNATNVENRAGSTLTFGALKGTMGKIVGNVTNNGNIIINAAGANAGTHTLITGTLTGGGGVNLINANSEFTNATLTNGNKTLNIVKNEAQIESFENTLSSNEKATLNTFGADIFSIGGANSANLRAAANDINSAIFSSFHANPLMIASLLDVDTKVFKVPKSKIIRRQIITKRVKSPKKRMIYTRQSFANTSETNAALIAKYISSKQTKGFLSGVRLGFERDFVGSQFILKFAYAHSNLQGEKSVNLGGTSDIAAFTTSTKSHNFALQSGVRAYFAGNLGLNLVLSGLTALANSTREFDFEALSLNAKLKSKHNLYQIALKSAFFYDFKMENFTLTPYFGVKNGYVFMPEFSESSESSLNLNAQTYKSYLLDALAGVKMGFDFGYLGEFGASLDYKFLAYQSQKERILRYANGAQGEDTLHFALPKSQTISLNLGYQRAFNEWYVGVKGSFDAILNKGETPEAKADFYACGAWLKISRRF